MREVVFRDSRCHSSIGSAGSRRFTVIEQGQVFKLKVKGSNGEPPWAYRYRLEGRGSARPQVGGFLRQAEAQKALRPRFQRAYRAGPGHRHRARDQGRRPGEGGSARWVPGGPSCPPRPQNPRPRRSSTATVGRRDRGAPSWRARRIYGAHRVHGQSLARAWRIPVPYRTPP
jgi:hypothetical protein